MYSTVILYYHKSKIKKGEWLPAFFSVKSTGSKTSMIYGVAALSACMLLGTLIGTVFGNLIGAGTEIGGVGFAMLLLIFITNSKKLTFTQKPAFIQGIQFWKAMFIPVVIAMTATQNVFHMLSGSIVALAAGAAAVGFSYLMLFVLHKLTEKKEAVEK